MAEYQPFFADMICLRYMEQYRVMHDGGGRNGVDLGRCPDTSCLSIRYRRFAVSLFDQTKIDKSFIARIGENGAPKSIIGVIVEMAHHMNMSVVAEGVETDEQLAYLAKSRCNFVQGYLFSRPVPEHDALRFLLPY